jgi:putative transposase
LIGRRVDVRYDPFDQNLVEVWHNGKYQKTVAPLAVGEFCGRKEKQPVTVTATRSRLLKVYEEEHNKRTKQRMGALSFKDMKGGDDNV